MKSRHPRKLAENAPAFSRGGANPREIPAAEAKARLSELLDAVERGETIAITRHGRRIARLTPDAQHRLQETRRVAQFAIAVDDAPDQATLMALTRQHRLTVYDAAYLELALREGVPLATLDSSLAAAARAEGVVVLGE